MGLVVNFSDFANISAGALSTSDYLVGYTGNPNRETRITLADLVNFMESVSGNDLYVVLYENSAKWDSTYSTLRTNSGAWRSSYTTLNGLSSALATVNTNSAYWETAYSQVQKLTGNFISMDSTNLTINLSNKDDYNKKTILLSHPDTANVVVGYDVGYGFSCKIINNSTHYIILSSALPYTFNAKGEYLNDQYGFVKIESDGINIYGYGDLESAIGPAYPDAILNEDQSYLLQDDDSLILY